MSSLKMEISNVRQVNRMRYIVRAQASSFNLLIRDYKNHSLVMTIVSPPILVPHELGQMRVETLEEFVYHSVSQSSCPRIKWSVPSKLLAGRCGGESIEKQPSTKGSCMKCHML